MNPLDPKVFHQTSLVAFLAWVGLGADGLSSSAHGPEEAYLALGQHCLLALPLAIMMALTRVSHNHTPFTLQPKLQFAGPDLMILPIHVFGNA